MKNLKLFTVLMLAALFLAVAVGCSRGHESQKNTGGTTIALKAGSYPLVKGDNRIAINISDSAGKPVTDANVEVRFYMPPMPGMTPMESRIQAILNGDKYLFTANVPMEGNWKAEVTVSQPGKQPVTTTFNVDAR